MLIPYRPTADLIAYITAVLTTATATSLQGPIAETMQAMRHAASPSLDQTITQGSTGKQHQLMQAVKKTARLSQMLGLTAPAGPRHTRLTLAGSAAEHHCAKAGSNCLLMIPLIASDLEYLSHCMSAYTDLFKGIPRSTITVAAANLAASSDKPFLFNETAVFERLTTLGLLKPPSSTRKASDAHLTEIGLVIAANALQGRIPTSQSSPADDIAAPIPTKPRVFATHAYH